MKKLLLIEDNIDIRDNIAEFLELNGFSVLTAKNGKAGVELALKEIPDLIVCDILMPVLDGYGVLYLLSKNPETSSIPFLFLTAKSEPYDVRRALGMGADDYITKPFETDYLLAAIEKRLKKSELSKSLYSRDEAGLRKFMQLAKYHFDLDIDPDQVVTQTFLTGHQLFSEKETPRFAYFLIKGAVQSYLINDDGHRFITNTHIPGNFIGYMAILEQVVHQDNAEITEDSIIMMIPADIFTQLLSYDNMLAKQFIPLLAGNDPERQDRISNLSYEGLRRKIAESILEIKSSREPISVTAVHGYLSDRSKVSNENILRILSDFRSERLIDFGQGEIKVLEEKNSPVFKPWRPGHCHSNSMPRRFGHCRNIH